MLPSDTSGLPFDDHNHNTLARVGKGSTGAGAVGQSQQIRDYVIAAEQAGRAYLPAELEIATLQEVARLGQDLRRESRIRSPARLKGTNA